MPLFKSVLKFVHHQHDQRNDTLRLGD